MKKLLVWFCILAAMAHSSAGAQTKKVTYYYTDPQGSVLAEADEQGNVVRKADYKPYGSSAMGSPQDGPSYTSHVSDVDTGLVYMQARYQDPGTGRFLSSDPAGVLAGDIFSFNRYGYADNNPTGKIDPDGRNAVVTYRANGSIDIAVPVNFSGNGMSSASIANIKADVASRWTGLYNVAGRITMVNVAIVDVTSATPKQAINKITLLNGPTSSKTGPGASFVNNGDSGEWNVTSAGMAQGEAAHETGHLMGDQDYYVNGIDSNGKRSSTPKATYSNNLMGTLGQVITDSRNMDVILNNPQNVVQHDPPPPPTPPTP